MNKKIFVLLMVVLLGCGKAVTPEPVQETQVPMNTETSLYSQYQNLFSNQTNKDSYTVSIRSDYEMLYSNDSKQQYRMDALLQAQNLQTSPQALVSENLDSDGMYITINGVYYNNRLYNNFNNVTYYDDMSYDQLKQSLLVSLDPMMFPQSAVNRLLFSKGDDNQVVTIELNDEATDIFLSQYDFADLDQYKGFKVTENEIIQVFDSNNHCIKEEVKVKGNLESSGVTVNVNYHSIIEYLLINQTSFNITNEDKTAHSAYVHYEQIDTNSISDYDPSLDSKESSVKETFKKRLVNRLKYEDKGNEVYQTSYNENESYIIDFTNHQFTYVNQGSRYVYNWLGDTGTFGTSCNYNYETKAQSESCNESVVEMLETVKLYLQMELYYCGLSLEDLVKEG